VAEPVEAEEAAPADDAPAAAADDKKEEAEAPKKEMANFVGEGDSCHFPDWIFSLAWLTSIVIVVYLAWDYGFPSLENLESLLSEYVDDGEISELETATRVLYIPLYCIGIVAAGSVVWIIIMLLCGKMLMWSFLLAIIGGSGYAAFTLYTSSSSSGSTMAMPFALICMFTIMYACSISARIAFASCTLNIATHVILEYFSLLFMAIFMIAVTAGYLIIWFVAIVGLYIYLTTACDDDECSNTVNVLIIYFTMLLFFFWTAEVLRNIVVVTTVGVVALWWTGQNSMLAVPMSFCRATTWNLGAICFGSLLIAIVKTLEAVIAFLEKQAKKSGNKIAEYALMCIGCIMKCLEECIKYMTAYAFCFVGIYGHSFMKAGYEVLVCIATDLPLLITNDGLVGTVILMGQLIMAAGGGYISYYLFEYKDWADGLVAATSKTDAESNLIMMGAAIGWGVSGILFGLVTAGNKAVLILWKEKSEYLKDSHPTFYEELDYIWTKSMGRVKAMAELDKEAEAGAEEGKEGEEA